MKHSLPLFTGTARPVGGTHQMLQDVALWEVTWDQSPNEVLFRHANPTDEMFAFALSEKLDMPGDSFMVQLVRDYLGGIGQLASSAFIQAKAPSCLVQTRAMMSLKSGFVRDGNACSLSTCIRARVHYRVSGCWRVGSG